MITRLFWFIVGAGFGALALFVYQKRAVIQEVPGTLKIAGGVSDIVQGFQSL